MENIFVLTMGMAAALLALLGYMATEAGFARAKIETLAAIAFPEVDKALLSKTAATFFRRFYAQQFKRSSMPDGPKIGSVALSPRGDLRLPSDLGPIES